MKRSGWFWLRLSLAVSCIVTMIRVSIPDYPYGASMWDFLIRDVGGLQHELAYISAIFLSLITITYFWQFIDTQRRFNALMVAAIKRIEKGL